MSQTLRSTFTYKHHNSARRSLVPARHAAHYTSLDALLAAMQQFVARTKTDLLQPRKQVIDRILREAGLLH